MSHNTVANNYLRDMYGLVLLSKPCLSVCGIQCRPRFSKARRFAAAAGEPKLMALGAPVSAVSCPTDAISFSARVSESSSPPFDGRVLRPSRRDAIDHVATSRDSAPCPVTSGSPLTPMKTQFSSDFRPESGIWAGRICGFF